MPLLKFLMMKWLTALNYIASVALLIGKHFEAPFNAHEAIKEAFKAHDTILFDCLTLYLSNYLCQEEAQSLSLDDLSDNVSMLMKELISAVRSVTIKLVSL